MRRVQLRRAVAKILAVTALTPRFAAAHCHVQYQVIGPGGLFYEVAFPPYQYLGVLPGGTTAQLGPQVSWSDTRLQEVYHTVQFSLTATDLTGSVSCPDVSMNVDGPPYCSDDGGGGPPPCTPSFTVTQTAPHSFSCSSTCASNPQPHPWLANYYPGNVSAPPVFSLSSYSAMAGAPSIAVEIRGSGFVGASQAQWNGSGLSAVFVDNATLLALLPSSIVASPGSNSVTVLNQGGPSSPLVFSVLASSTAISNPSTGSVFNARAYPNPWMPSVGTSIVTFDGMPAGASVRLFSISGRLVNTLDASAGTVKWDLNNSSGERVASGYYFYLITGEGFTQRGRLAIIR